MPSELFQRYEALADHYRRQGDSEQRDACLLLAAEAALVTQRNDEAERLRRLLLTQSPYHLLRPYASLPEAMDSEDIRDYLDSLRAQYSQSKIDRLYREIMSMPGRVGLGDPFGMSESPVIADGPIIDDPRLHQGNVPDANRHDGLFAAGDAFGTAQSAPISDAIDAQAQAQPFESDQVHAIPAENAPIRSLDGPIASSPASAAEARRRRSPYDLPDYGPQVPAEVEEGEAGSWVPMFLVFVVAGLALVWVVFGLARPFLNL